MALAPTFIKDAFAADHTLIVSAFHRPLGHVRGAALRVRLIAYARRVIARGRRQEIRRQQLAGMADFVTEHISVAKKATFAFFERLFTLRYVFRELTLSRQYTRAFVIGIIMASAVTSAPRSQNLFEQLVSPGPVISGHAKYEKDCRSCHEPFSRKSQTRLCLACHKETAADRQTGKKLHGRQTDAAKLECVQCHTDHKGRDADILLFDPETFNHAFTNFELRDAHKSVQCDGCHAKNVKFRNAPGRCFDCHKPIDPHKGRLGEACDDCHDEAAWLRVKAYNHDKTKFPLRAGHRDVACSVCHVGERYKGIGTACVDCHTIQDVHTRRYGAKCETCHDQNKWTTINFNHDKDTKFPLRNAHAKVKCDTCHPGDLFRDKPATTCVSCHRNRPPDRRSWA